MVQTIDTMMLLASPFPENESVLVLNQTSQIVDDTMRPVPLSEASPIHSVAAAYCRHAASAELQHERVQLSAQATLLIFDLKVPARLFHRQMAVQRLFPGVSCCSSCT